MTYNPSGIKTFIAGANLEARRLVKVDTSSTVDPPEVEYAGAGEDAIGVTEYKVASGEPVSVKLLNHPGTFEVECLVDSAIARGTLLYAGANGVVTDASSGSVVGQALEVGASGAIIEVGIHARKPTTAAGTTITDAGSFTGQATVEAALQEIYQHMLSAQNFIPIPLTALREASSMAVGNIAANGGVLASDTTPILQPINGDTDGCQVLVWAASNNDQVLFSIPLPPDINVAADIVLHCRTKSGGTTDAVGFTVDSWFNEGDTKVTDTSETNQTTSWAEKIATIDAADVPAGAQTLTVGLTPVAHTTDTLSLSAVWLEYKAGLRTS